MMMLEAFIYLFRFVKDFIGYACLTGQIPGTGYSYIEAYLNFIGHPTNIYPHGV
ncbi:hypothetical protein [Pseudomonas yamanorum]|jgi:hypothetical protein|uniref:hypothetical protein n=1 Tax=Pseudomonas yamanorum TaxID=515393 RepID=UPI003B9E3B83